MGFTIVPAQMPISTPPGATSQYPGTQITSASNSQSITAREKAIQAIEALNQKASEMPEISQVTEQNRQNHNGDTSSQTDHPQKNNSQTNETSNSTSQEGDSTSIHEKPKLSAQYAELARKEKLLRSKAQQLAAKEAGLKAKTTNAAAATESGNSLLFDESKYVSKEKLKQDLFGTISELGMTYDDVTAQALNAPTPEQLALTKQIKALEAKIAELEGNQSEVKKTFEQQQVEARASAEKQITYEVQSLIKHNPEFETIRETNSTKDVVELIGSVFDHGLGIPGKTDYYPPGTLLSAEEAARMVETYLIDEALKITKLKKIQSRLNPPAQQMVDQQKEKKLAGEKEIKQSQLNTLTNNLTATQKPLTARERAILVGEGKLAPSWKR